MQLTSSQVDESLRAIQTIFRQVRPLVLAGAGKAVHTTKHDGSPVTDIDVSVENTLLTELERLFPGMAVYGEETGYADNLTGDFWLVDPIDGSKSFLEGIPAYTGMAVLIQDGEATASVIYNYQENDMYVAKKSKGAFKNDTERLDLTKTPLPTRAFCRERLVDAANDMLAETGVVCEAGPSGAGYGFSEVADGRLAARLNFPYVPGGGYPHDFAPGALLVREARGAIVPVEDGPYTYHTRSFVACHPKLEATVRKHVKELRRQEVQTAAH
jgi:fructose-1,6-bisphosphatase/inositol monophosphatase family enzyme